MQKMQGILHPCTLWSVAFDENQDIFTVGEDGYIRVFTQKSEFKVIPLMLGLGIGDLSL